MGLTQLSSGASQALTTDAGGFITLNFGNHVCTQADNLYVTIQASGELGAVDVSAIVDEPVSAFPLRLTEYSDNTFTSPNNLMAVSWDSAKAVVDEDAYNVEIRNSISSSAPSLISANAYYKSMLVAHDYQNYFGLLNMHKVALTTTYNYNASAVTDRILTIEQMVTTQSDKRQASAMSKQAMFASKVS